ncbi:MAG: hypothetical protein IJF83_10590 [Methanobrevibacter sp.]|nr:hypothetical protein [Methanobrevibacter sp.]
MTIKRDYVLGIVDDECIPKFEKVLTKYASSFKVSSAHVYFARQPISFDNIPNDVIFFQVVDESESSLDKKIKNMFKDLDKLGEDYLLRDGKTGEFTANVRHGGHLEIRFDNLKKIKKGTFDKIDELKLYKSEFGFCKGIKANFHPIEGISIENLMIEPELIYIACKSEEDLEKMKVSLIDMIKEIDPGLDVEFVRYFNDR